MVKLTATHDNGDLKVLFSSDQSGKLLDEKHILYGVRKVPEIIGHVLFVNSMTTSNFEQFLIATGSRISVVFRTLDNVNAFSGHSGCRTYTGSFAITGYHTFKPIDIKFTEKKDCEERLHQQDDLFEWLITKMTYIDIGEDNIVTLSNTPDIRSYERLYIKLKVIT
jgi:hypothetical protein